MTPDLLRCSEPVYRGRDKRLKPEEAPDEDDEGEGGGNEGNVLQWEEGMAVLLARWNERSGREDDEGRAQDCGNEEGGNEGGGEDEHDVGREEAEEDGSLTQGMRDEDEGKGEERLSAKVVQRRDSLLDFGFTRNVCQEPRIVSFQSDKKGKRKRNVKSFHSVKGQESQIRRVNNVGNIRKFMTARRLISN